MAIIYPRDMPSCHFSQAEFVPQYAQSHALTGGGPNAVDLAPVLWRGAWTIDVITREDAGIWSAWLASLRGGLKTFKGVPPKRRWPLKYPRGFGGLNVAGGGGAFSGAGNLSAIGVNRDTITVNQLPAGLILNPGDFVSIVVGTRQHLHMIVEGGVSSGAGAVTVTVEPTIRPNAVTGVAALLEAPYCEMGLSGDWQMVRDIARVTFSFKSLQVIL